jgi:hypothetical protein
VSSVTASLWPLVWYVSRDPSAVTSEFKVMFIAHLLAEEASQAEDSGEVIARV